MKTFLVENGVVVEVLVGPDGPREQDDPAGQQDEGWSGLDEGLTKAYRLDP